MDKRTGKPYIKPPQGTMTTRQAAVLMKRSLSSTYNYLKKNNVKYYIVFTGENRSSTYWDYDEIRQLEQKLPKRELKVPKELIQAKDVLSILNIVRSTLYRYVLSGKIKEIKRRVMSTRGYRHQSLFLKSEVMRLKAWRNARKSKNITWREFNRETKIVTNEYAEK